jgi:metal-dependent hydrolase (beta-lactamase superfamily II)
VLVSTGNTAAELLQIQIDPATVRPTAHKLVTTAERKPNLLPHLKIFLQKRLPQKGYPLSGANRFWTGFWERGHEQFSEIQESPLPGGRITYQSSDKMPVDRRPIDWAPDEFDHEISTCVNVKGRGLVVMTSCGHRGVVNSVKQAMTVSALQKVHAVLGGFHLAPHNEDYVRQTIKGLVDLDIDHIVPMHCTGEPFYEILKAELPKKVIRSYTGTKLVFGA